MTNYTYAYLLFHDQETDLQYCWRGQFTSYDNFRAWLHEPSINGQRVNIDLAMGALPLTDPNGVKQPERTSVPHVNATVFYVNPRSQAEVYGFHDLTRHQVAQWRAYADTIQPHHSEGPGRKRARFLEMTDYRTRKFRNDPER